MKTFGTVPASMLSVRDGYLGPALLTPFANEMARRLKRLSLGSLLETAAGTGILTEALRPMLAAGMTMIASDPDPLTVQYAARKPGLESITWRTFDPRQLPFGDGTFGIVASSINLNPVPERVRVFQEARRVLKFGGRFVFSVLGNLRYNPVSRCVNEALTDLFPDSPPEYLVQVMHGYADNELIDNDLTIAGFTDAIYIAVDLPLVAAAAYDIAMGYCLGTPLRYEIEDRAPGDTARVVQSVSAALERRYGSGGIVATMRGHIVTASG